MLEELGRHAADRPTAPALIETTGRSLSYGQLTHAVDAVAAGLDALGVRAGHRVLFAVRPSHEAFVLILALLRVGAALVALEPGVGPQLLARRIALADAHWVMAESLLLVVAGLQRIRWLPEAWRIAVPLPPPTQLERSGLRFVRVGPWLPGLPPSTSFTALARQHAADLRRDAEVSAEEPTFIVFTSGTTEAPKAVVHTRRSVAATMEMFVRHLALDASAVVYGTDLHHVLPALSAGARAAVPRRGYSPRQTLRMLEQHGVTHLFSTPGSLAELAACLPPGGRLPGTLRCILLGSAPVAPGVLHRVRPVLWPTTEVWCIYGMTEALPLCRVDIREKLAFEGPGDLAGRPFPEVSLELAPDGELLVRGPHMAHRYLGQPPLAQIATGDLADIDASGRVILLGRKKDMIIRRGPNVYPALYEPTISQIAGVSRCVLIGVPDRSSADEMIVLVVQPAAGVSPTTLLRQLPNLLRRGPHRIDSVALPDSVMAMQIPVVRRSQELDRAAVRRAVAEMLRHTAGHPAGC